MSDITCVRNPPLLSTTINGLTSSSVNNHNSHRAQSFKNSMNNVKSKSLIVGAKTNCISHKEWKVQASDGAMNTSNPIREIIETMNLAENPEKKVIPLSIGDPTIFGNLKPCKEILDALQKANVSGKYYGYQTAAGMEVAREAVADYHFKCTGNKVKLQDIILASGCSHAIDLCICVLARHGQNILIPRPGFPLYKTLTSVYGIQYKQYNLIAEKNWCVDLKHLESLIDENTSAIIVNNPSNPCGSVFSKRHLLQILRLAEKYRLPIIADEIYDKFVFSPQRSWNTELEPPMDTSNQDKNTKPSYLNNKQNYSNIENELPIDNIVNVDQQHNTILSNKISKYRGAASNIDVNLSVDSSNDKSITDCCESDRIQMKKQMSNDVETEGDDDLDEGPFDYVPFRSLASLSEIVPILTCGGISKTCLIPGLRLGWIIINDKKGIFDHSIRNGLSRLTQRLMGPNSLVQGALHDILTNVPEHFYRQTMDFIFKNARLCYDRLSLVEGLQPYMPQGSMYLMVRFDPKLFPDIDGDLDFTSKLMNEESVLVLPGKCFDFPNFFRVCLTVPTNVMDEALRRIQQFCERHAVIPVKEINGLSLKSNDQPKQNNHISTTTTCIRNTHSTTNSGESNILIQKSE